MSTASETEPLRELGLFAGAGGGLLASRLLGWRTVCAVELEPYCQRVLAQRQRDGHLEPFPIWDDVRTFDGRPWRGRVDVVSGGFPCQDISSAGRGAGLDGDRSSLWFSMLRIIGEVRPAFVFAENSPMLRTRGLDRVVKGLAALGYVGVGDVFGADDVGAPHKRKRMWIVAAHPDVCRERGFTQHAEVASAPGTGGDDGHANSKRQRRAQHEPTQREGDTGGATPTHTHGVELRQQSGRRGGQSGEGPPQPGEDSAARGTITDAGSTGIPELRPRGLHAQHAVTAASDGTNDREWWGVHRFAGVDDGLADRVGAIKATGNGQVPAVAALAWRILAPLAESASRGV